MINIGFDENTAIDEFILDIRDKKQVIKARYALNDKDKEKNVIMSEHYIELSFELDSYVRFVRSDYIIWEGERYILKEKYKPNQENTSKYKYTLRFDHWTTLLQEATFYYLNQDMEEVEWKLTSNAATFFQLIADNANRYFGFNTFNVGTIEFSEIKFIQFDKTNVWDAATQVADAYKGEWYLSDTTFHLVKKFSFGSEIEFLTDVSIEKMDRSEGENANNLTRIVALGSTRNIPTNYRQPTSGESVDAVFQKRLRIPAEKGNVIDALPNMSPEEAIEGVVIFEDIFPQRIGTMSNVTVSPQTDTNTDTGVVTKWNAFRFKDIGLQFKKEYLLPSVELRIIFQSGNLNGMDFAVKFNPEGLSETNPDAQVFEIVRNETYGRPLPNDTLKPQNGDTYILYGFNIKMVSDIYVPAGEQELYDTAVDWLIDNNKDKSVYECFTMIQHFEDHAMDLEIGQKVKLIHDQFEGGFRSSRIQGYEKYLINKYQATYTIGDNAAYSWAIQVNETIQELQIAGISFQATGGNGVYLITQFDNTPPSDFNAYSAVASNARYLNRQTGGTVQGDTTFQKDIRVQGKAITHTLQNETYSSGLFGSGFKMWLLDGLSYLEVDNIMVRREMLINILTIAKVQAINGGFLNTLANMSCNKVEELANGYKCYFDNDNGNIYNTFKFDDQAQCRTWNGANAKYYWRLVTEIGSDYIVLSKTDKDGSGIPAEKDEIIQFGNRTDPARQAAIYTTSYGVNAPAQYHYSGVNSYDLTGKAKTYFTNGDNRIEGNFIIQSTGKSVPETIDAIQVGGRNLLRDSGISVTSSTYNIKNYTLSSAIQNGEVCTVTIRGKLGADRIRWQLYNSGGSVILTSILPSDEIESGVYRKTFNWTVGGSTNNQLWVYQVPSTGTSSSTITNIKLERGNKGTDWTEAPEDAQARISAAQTTATNAQTAAAAAQTSANAANSLLADIANDNKLDPSEKQTVLLEWNVIQSEYIKNTTQAANFSISSAAYTTAYNSLSSYITPLLSNMNTTSDIVGTTFRSTFKAYYDSRTDLLNTIAAKARDLANTAQSTADNALVEVSQAKASIVVLNNQITSKVEQSDFNTLRGRVSDAESSIVQNANNITTTVTKVDAKSAIYRSLTSSTSDRPPIPYSKNDMWITYDGAIRQSTTTRLSGLFVDSDWVLSTKYIDESAISAIKIGGVNFLSNLKSFWKQGAYVSSTGVYNGGILTHICTVAYTNVKPNTSYGVSFGSTYKVDVIEYAAQYIKGNNFIANTVFTTSPTTTFLMLNISKIAGGNMTPEEISNVKIQLEEGTKITGFSPSNQDIQSGIDTAQSTADTKNRLYYQDLTPTAPVGGFRDGDIWYKVSLVDFDGNINGNSALNKYQLQQRWNGVGWIKINWSASRSWVKQTDDQILSVVEKTGIDGLGAGETLKSLIDQTPTKIELAVSSIRIANRNYLRRKIQQDGWSPNVTGSASFQYTSEYVRMSSATTLGGFRSLSDVLTADLSGSPVVLSFSMRANWNVSATISQGGVSQNVALIQDQWQRVNMRISSFNPSAAILILNVATQVWHDMKDFQITLGTTISDYSLSPEDVQSSIDSKTTSAEVASSLSIQSNKISLFSTTIELKGTTIADAIKAESLDVGNGNFHVGTDGIISAKGATLSGLFESNSTNNKIKIDPTRRAIVFEDSNGLENTYWGFESPQDGYSRIRFERSAFGGSDVITADFDTLGVILSTSTHQCILSQKSLELKKKDGTTQFIIDLTTVDGKLRIIKKNLPSSPLGLEAGREWRDENGFSRIV